MAAPANQVVCGGQPYFVSGFLGDEGAGSPAAASPTEQIQVNQPRIYYGEQMPTTTTRSSARPTGARTPSSTGRSRTPAPRSTTPTTGKGGVPIGSFFRRLLYAIKDSESNFLLSDAVNDNSKLLYVRDPRDRVEKVAPFLTLDGDPYPAVVDGRIQWILDGYTTAATYPYAAADQPAAARPPTSSTGPGHLPAGPGERQLHAQLGEGHRRRVRRHGHALRVRRQRPGAQGVEQGVRRRPDQAARRRSRPALAAHFRYPEDLFKVQRNLLTKFHVTDPGDFFSGQDFWQVPNVPGRAGQRRRSSRRTTCSPSSRARTRRGSSSPRRSPRTAGRTWPR